MEKTGMRHWRKWALGLLIAAALVPMAALTVKAKEGDIASGENENGWWRITAQGQLLAEFDGPYPKDGQAPAWKSYATSIKTAEVSLKNCSNMSYLFSGCTNLTEITWKDMDTSQMKNMSWMFQNCAMLEKLDLSSFDTSQVTNMSGAFRGCAKLQSLHLEGFDTTQVTDMKNLFKECKALQYLYLGNLFQTAKVTNMASMFEGCQALAHLSISRFDTSQVQNMAKMFYNCRAWEDLDVGQLDTAQVTDMNSMFYNCYAVKTLQVENFDTAKVTNMSQMFRGCKELETLDVSNFQTGAVRRMDYLFSGCKKLTALNLSKFDTTNVTDMTDMFKSCSGLTALDISNFTLTGVTAYFSLADLQAAESIKLPMGIKAVLTFPVTEGMGWYDEENQKVTEAYSGLPVAMTYLRGYCVTGISLLQKSMRFGEIGQKGQLTAFVVPSNARNKAVVFQSSDERIVTVDEKGSVRAVAPGVAQITVTTKEGGYTESCGIIVHIHQWSQTWKTDDKVHYHVCEAENCDITEPQKMDGYGEHLYNNEADVTCKICGYVRTIPVTGIALSESELRLDGAGATKQLTASVVPSYATQQAVTYASADESIATVSADGTVTAVKNGRTKITATTVEGGFSAVCTVTVHIHQWSEKWKKDEKAHYHVCEAKYCDITEPRKMDGYEKHVYENKKDSTCNICAYHRDVDESGSSGNLLDGRKDLPLLIASGKQAKGNQMKLSWDKYTGAKGYEIYWSYCGSKPSFKLLKSQTKTEYLHKNLKTDRSYAYFVVAYKKVDGNKVYLAKSPQIHVAMDYDKTTNIKNMKLNKSTLTLNAGKAFQIKATLTKQDPGKKIIDHVEKLRYYSSDETVAGVSAKGKITARRAGNCTIYVVAPSGLTKKVKLKVK